MTRTDPRKLVTIVAEAVLAEVADELWWAKDGEARVLAGKEEGEIEDSSEPTHNPLSFNALSSALADLDVDLVGVSVQAPGVAPTSASVSSAPSPSSFPPCCQGKL